MAITSAAQVAQALPGQRIMFSKTSATARAAGLFHSYWRLGAYPLAAATPPAYTAGSGYIPTNTTQGALPFVNPPGGQNSYLGQLRVAAGTVGTLIVYDRLWHCSGMSGTVTTAQNVTTPGSLTAARDPNNGADVEPWFEVYTATGATGTGVYTLAGTAADGGAWSGTYTRPSAAADTLGMMAPFIATTGGQTGIRQVTGVTLNSTTGTAGSFGVTLLRRIAEVPIEAVNREYVFDWQMLGLPRIYDGSCLGLMFCASATTAGAPLLNGALSIIQG